MSDTPPGFTPLATAHLTWEERWASDAGRAGWLAPEPEVIRAVELLQRRAARRALDLGCGVGRHTRLLVHAGLETHGADASTSGLTFARAQPLGERTHWTRAGFEALPFGTATFDYVLAWNVIYHGDRAVVAGALTEIRRVLRPSGLLQFTMLSKRNPLYGQGRQVATDTYVADTDDEEKRHPHYYCDAAGLIGLLDGFEPLYLLDRERAKPGSWHWIVVAERRPD